MAAAKPKTSARRKHLVNRLKAFTANVENLGEDFTLDKKIERAIDKIEGRMKHHNATVAYRKANAKRREERAESKAIEQAELEKLEAEQSGIEVQEEIEPTPPEIAEAPGLRNVEAT